MDDKQVNRRLIKLYGITLAEYENLLIAQLGGCAICKRPPIGRRLHVDHDHKAKHTKIDTSLAAAGFEKWNALAIYNGAYLLGYGNTKFAAIQHVRELLKKASVRGILCWTCNTGLQKWRDKPELMEAAAKYLRDFESRHKQ